MSIFQRLPFCRAKHLHAEEKQETDHSDRLPLLFLLQELIPLLVWFFHLGGLSWSKGAPDYLV